MVGVDRGLLLCDQVAGVVVTVGGEVAAHVDGGAHPAEIVDLPGLGVGYAAFHGDAGGGDDRGLGALADHVMERIVAVDGVDRVCTAGALDGGGDVAG